ncbi:hypothetical protein D9M71_172870 [compost metagenome]
MTCRFRRICAAIPESSAVADGPFVGTPPGASPLPQVRRTPVGAGLLAKRPVQAVHIPLKKHSISPFAKVGKLLAVAALRPLQASKVCFKGTGKTGGSLSVNQQCPHKRCRPQSRQSGRAAVAAGHAGDDDVAGAAVPAGRVLHLQHCPVHRRAAGVRLCLAPAGFRGVSDHFAGGDAVAPGIERGLHAGGDAPRPGRSRGRRQGDPGVRRGGDRR